MADLRTAAQQALEALEKYRHMMFIEAGCRFGDGDAATDALRAALAQQEDIAQNLQSRLDAALLLEERRQEIAQPRRETEQEPTVRIKCTVVDNQHPSGVPFEQWVNAPRRETEQMLNSAYQSACKIISEQDKKLKELETVNAELLEALKQALEECIWPNERLSDVHEKARAAIAKAEGEQK
jgi:hypothetical protein